MDFGAVKDRFERVLFVQKGLSGHRTGLYWVDKCHDANWEP